MKYTVSQLVMQYEDSTTEIVWLVIEYDRDYGFESRNRAGQPNSLTIESYWTTADEAIRRAAFLERTLG